MPGRARLLPSHPACLRPVTTTRSADILSAVLRISNPPAFSKIQGTKQTSPIRDRHSLSVGVQSSARRRQSRAPSPRISNPPAFSKIQGTKQTSPVRDRHSLSVVGRAVLCAPPTIPRAVTADFQSASLLKYPRHQTNFSGSRPPFPFRGRACSPLRAADNPARRHRSLPICETFQTHSPGRNRKTFSM